MPSIDPSIDNQDEKWMAFALSLAAKGKGDVEPNPMVGCVVVRDGELLASGYHARFGGPHAEVHALASLSNDKVAGSTIYVTLEPCSHFGKTPPCVDLVISKRPARVVIAMQDPFPAVSGRGIQKLQENGIEVSVGCLEQAAQRLNAPYLKLVRTNRPWVIAKWAMTLDGAIATRTGDSKWISGEESRQWVHRLRAQCDAIVTGIGTVLADDPMLNARLPSDGVIQRVAKRVVLDRRLQIPESSQLVRSAKEIPLLVVASKVGSEEKKKRLRSYGVELFELPEEAESRTIESVLDLLGSLRCTNLLMECGSTLLGAALEKDLVDQIECFIAPKIVGGNGVRPLAGAGVDRIADAMRWEFTTHQQSGDDLRISAARKS